MRELAACGGVLVFMVGLVAASVVLEPETPVHESPPGAIHAPSLRHELATALRDKGAGYVPRTEHLKADGAPLYTNRLILQTSPYLLQHAHNPVDWHPWGEEAFAMAQERGVPVFLSVGYSTCHWCHVMERESFEDLEIARFLNQNFVCIKVDREERPDVDAVYMAAVHALNRGNGGWPMSVWMTPEKQPFYAGTYFPPRDGMRGGRRPGFLTVLQQLTRHWTQDRDAIYADAAGLSAHLQKGFAHQGGSSVPGVEVLDRAEEQTLSRFDPVHGGIDRRPKFPSSTPIRFLLTRENPAALHMAEYTLDRIRAGGIHDHAGGGFHRYSVDERWLVPHFEKMLYDQARLTLDYLAAYERSGKPEFAWVVRRTLQFVDRELGTPSGLVASALDADSLGPSGESEEGFYYSWTPAELSTVLGSDADLAASAWNVTPSGQFEGRSLLHFSTPPSLAQLTGLQAAADALYEARSSRTPPLRDDKAIVSWNGQAIAAWARAGRLLQEPEYIERAERNATLLLAERVQGRLVRTITEGEPHGTGFLSDYANLQRGLIELFQATGTALWLEEAIALDRVLADDFEDPAGGFFQTPVGHEELLAREKPIFGGAQASGNAVLVGNLLRLYALTSDVGYLERAERALTLFAPVIERSPTASSELLVALSAYWFPPKEVVLVHPAGVDPAMAAVLRQPGLLPHVVIPVAATLAETVARVSPLVEGKVAREGKTTAYVCEAGVCKQPTTDPAQFARLLSAD